MGYVINLFGFLLFSAVVFQRSIFLGEEVPFSPKNASQESTEHQGLEDFGVEKSKSSTETPKGSGESPSGLTSPDLSQDQLSVYSASSAFHPPLEDEFWNLFLRQRNYLRPARSGPLGPPTSISVNGAKVADEDMPSFEEWRHQRLQDAQKEKNDQAGTANSTGKRRQRALKNTNYASVICGAKVTAHNPELENPGAILTANRDDYMLNPCKSARKYFVVELCESVHIHGFDIGNLELFSNVPKTIQVLGSARFPSREWTDFGKFELQEARTMQNFTVPAGTGFVKFVRVEMLEHYGKEHYCPITVFRVFGTSMVEEYVDSVDDDDSDDEEASGSRSDGQVATLNEDGDMERDKWGQGLIESNVNPITMAKDMVVSFVRKAASSGYNLINGAAGHNSTPAPCRNTTAVISSLRSNASEIRNGTQTSANIAPSSPLLSLCFDNIGGWDVATVTCQYVWCLFQASNASLSFCPGTGKATKNSESPATLLSACDPQPEDGIDRLSVNEETTSYLPAGHETVAVNVSVVGEVVHPVKLPTVEEEVVSTGDPKASKFVTVNEKEQPRNLPSDLASPKNKTPEDAASVENQRGKGISSAEHVTETSAVPVPSITNGVPGQKESVFVRLGNRLKTLELNMSLSGQYLHELSRRFKKQGEDSAKNFTIAFAKLMELSRTESDFHGSLMERLREVEMRNQVLETQTVLMKKELQMLRWVVPLLCVLSVLLVLISMAVALYFLPRFVRGLVVKEAQRQHAHGQTNGHAPGHAPGHSPGHAPGHSPGQSNGHAPGFQLPKLSVSTPLQQDQDGACIKKKHKKHKRHLLISETPELPTPPRLVPGSANEQNFQKNFV